MKKNIALVMMMSIMIPSLAFADRDENKGSDRIRVGVEVEDNINNRRIELQKKLFKQEIEDRRSDFERIKEEYRELRESDDANKEEREMKKKEFRAKFAERFKFTIEKLSEFQERMKTRLETESKAGIDVSKSEVKLNESISFMASIESDISSLKTLLDSDYTESEREVKKKEAKELVEKIKANIKASHAALKESLKELRIAKSAEVELGAEVEVSN